jgi:hypothetical protein
LTDDPDTNTANKTPETMIKVQMGLICGKDNDRIIDMDCDYEEGKRMVFRSEFKDGIDINANQFIPDLDLGISADSGTIAFITSKKADSNDDQPLGELQALEGLKTITTPKEINSLDTGGYKIFYLDLIEPKIDILSHGINFKYFKLLYASNKPTK